MKDEKPLETHWAYCKQCGLERRISGLNIYGGRTPSRYDLECGHTTSMSTPYRTETPCSQ